MAKKAHEEEHENSERWLLTYADLITLVLAIFVVLYSTAQQDTEKFRKAMAAMADQLNPADKAPTDRNIGFGKEAYMAQKAGADQKAQQAAGKDGKDGKDQGREGHDGKDSGRQGKDGKEAGKETLESVQASLMQDKNIGKGLSVKMTELGLVISVEEKLLFDSGSADFKPGATGVLAQLAGHLRKVKNPIRINGHTDNVPIHNKVYASNWHLSSGRAIKAAEFLIMTEKLPMDRIHVAGYADGAPAADNRTADGRAKNRRVELVLVKDESAAAKAPESCGGASHG